MYDTALEASQKLAQCVVSYDGKPFCVVETSGNNGSVVLHGKHLKASTTDSHPINDPLWDFRDLSSHLGYSNVEWRDYKQAVYSRRVPVRSSRQTQGLSHQNVRVTKLSGNKSAGIPGSQLSFLTLQNLDGFLKTWHGKFPDLKTVKDELAEHPEIVSQAFGRYLAVQRSPLGVFYLMYKETAIGFSEDCDRFKVPPHYRYLDELLIEDHHLTIQ